LKKSTELNFDLKQLRSFLEVLKQKSFTRASRKLKLGQATISHHIKELEEALGTELINRTSKQISITEQGRKFQIFCEQLFAGIEDFAVGIGRGVPGGITRIAASTIPAAFILPKVLAAIKSTLPDLVYRIEVAGSREAVEMAKEGRADIAVVGEEYKHPTLTYIPLYRDRIVLIGSSNDPDRISIAELSRLPFIIREPGSGTRRVYERALAEQKVRPSNLRVVMECSSVEGILQSVAAGIGVSFISGLAVKNINRKSSLKIMEVEGLEIYRHFYLVYAAKRSLPHQATIVIDSLVEYGSTQEKIEA
jgi:LysR family transcriptional regulator, transcriptional activator of the cysJI operon